MAMIEMLRCMESEDYEVSLLVLLGQGELIDRVPPYVVRKNAEYMDTPILTEEGRRHLKRTVWKALWKRATLFRRFFYLTVNVLRMIRRGKIQPDKLLWRILADSAPRLEETYDLAVAYLEGGSAYYVADYVKAEQKAAFVHIDYGRAGYDRKLDGSCYLNFNQIFTVSEEVKESLLLAYPECKESTEVFQNLIDREEILKRIEEEGFTDAYQGIRLLTVGRLTWQKAYDVAIDAMKLIKEAGVQARWYVLGEGDQREVLEKKVDRLGLQEDFVLLGARENPYPFFSEADIYVHATRFEGKSIAIQEAQVLGKPVIASDCSGNREQLDDGWDGRLCSLTPESIRDGILELIEQPELRALYGRRAAQRNVGGKEEIQKLLKLLE